MHLDDLLPAIGPADAEATAAARARQDTLAKPPGSLGSLEELGARLAGMARSCPPPIPASPALIVCAGDHGVHAEGVTPWRQDITAAIATTICRGRAASSVLAGQVGATIDVLDVGVAADLPPHDRLTVAKVRPGTRNLLVEDAMTADEAVAAIEAGATLAARRIQEGADLLVTGDMGIANTTASACLIAALSGAGPDVVTGRGTGIDDAMLSHKIEVVTQALDRASRVLITDPGDANQHTDALATLAALGGLEHAALVGVMLAGAAARVPVLLDGVITCSAAIVAAALAPDVVDHLVAGHESVEPGAAIALKHLGLDPLLDLDLRLGEGTGALLAVPLVQAAASILTGMATLDELA